MKTRIRKLGIIGVITAIIVVSLSTYLATMANAQVARGYEAAVRSYQAAAERGDETAQFTLGFMYYEGRGVERDYVKAVRWYRAAAEQGFAIAQKNLDSLYALEQFLDDAVAGDAFAQTELASSFLLGRGVPRDYEQALRWFEAAVQQKYPDAQAGLARMYQHGQGVPINIEKARELYQMAADGGSEFGVQGLAALSGKSPVADVQSGIAPALCGAHQNVMLKVIFQHRAQGIPIGMSEDVFDHEDDVRTRVFLKRFVRSVYEHPDSARNAIESGEFLTACIKTYRGY